MPGFVFGGQVFSAKKDTYTALLFKLVGSVGGIFSPCNMGKINFRKDHKPFTIGVLFCDYEFIFFNHLIDDRGVVRKFFP